MLAAGVLAAERTSSPSRLANHPARRSEAKGISLIARRSRPLEKLFQFVQGLSQVQTLRGHRRLP